MQISGRAYFDDGRPAADVTLRFVSVGFNGRADVLAETSTGGDGAYSVTVQHEGPVNLEVRAVTDGGRVNRAPGAGPSRAGTPSADDEPTVRLDPHTVDTLRSAETARVRTVVRQAGEASEIRLTGVRHGLQGRFDGPLNVVVPARLRPMAGEYERLDDDVRPHLGDARLRSAVEDGVTNDLTLLSSATSWDARLLALAATADKLSRGTGVQPPALYGMLRAGLPTDPVQLARVDAGAVDRALRGAVEAGVVGLDEEQIRAAVQAHEAYAVKLRRRMVGAGTVSSWGDVLATTKLPQEQTSVLETLFTEHSRDRDVDGFWDAAERRGLPADTLRVSARLAHLTLNNADLIGDLQRGVDGSADLGPALVRDGLYRPDRWTERITALSGQDPERLDGLIPPAYDGADTAERLTAYAADLARKVRLSYPTQVIGDMVATGALALRHDEVRDDVARVLDTAANRHGFALGRTPVNTFLAEHGGELFAGMGDDQVTKTTAQVKTLARLYQVTPDDESMQAMLAAGFGSALDVTAVSYETFLDTKAHLFAGPQVADRIYRKAQQVTTVVYSFLGVVQQAGAEVVLPVASPPVEAVAAAKSELIKQYPTLETLFGSMDFCECDHCRSILGPAAYLVNLLRFLDPAPEAWAKRLADWKTAHGGAPYPYADIPAWKADGEPAPMTPYEVLTQRRPDLPKLPLTCENTNTALPYLDIVNEILEQYTAEGTLAGMPVYDTGNATSENLIAEPANQLAKAYSTLKAARYPLTLPFDLFLTTVRAFCDHFDAPLWTLLDTLRPTDALYPAGSEPYGRAAVFLERLGLTPDELRLLTAANPLPTWTALYGYDGAVTETQALTELSGAVTLSRRLGVTYRELVALVRTGFANPGLAGLATLRRLDLSMEDALRYRAAAGHAPFTAEEKAALEAKLGPVGVTWLQGVDLTVLGSVLVLADPGADPGFTNTVLRRLDGTPAQPFDFLLLNLFVRLQRRLRRPIEDLDRALLTFLPTTPDPRTATTIGAALRSALLGLAHLDVLAADLKTGKRGRTDLLALWADLDDRHYTALFRSGALPTADPAFDHPLGDYLSDGSVPLKAHLAAVQSALRLTADDIAAILAAATAHTVDDAPLTMPVVSVLHRHALLARLLKLPVADLLALKGLTGLDPFTPTAAAPVADLADDHAFTQTMAFVEAVRAVKELGVERLNFLLRHRFDPLGPRRAAAEPPFALLRGLAAEITRIRAEHAVPADPALFTDDVLRARLALVFPADVTEALYGMWTDTVPLRAVRPAAPAAALDPADFAALPQVTVVYDPVRQEQQLVHRGVLRDGERAALLAAVTGAQPAYLAGLLDDVQAQGRALFDRHLLRATVPGVGETGFLAAGDFDTLFAAPPLTAAADRDRRALLAEALLPYLRDRLIRQAVITAVAADLGTAPAFTEALLTDTALLDRPDQPGQALLGAYAAAAGPGLSTDSAGGAVTLTGHVEVPATGPYRFTVAGLPVGTLVSVRFGHLADPLLHTTTSSAAPEPSAFTELKAGQPYAIIVRATGTVTPMLLAQGETVPQGPVTQLITYPRDGVDALHRAHLLLGKTTELLGVLGLDATEATYLLTHPADFDGLDLGELPTRAADDTDVTARELFAQVLRLCAYARLKGELGADLTPLLAAARRAFPGDVTAADAREQTLAGLASAVGAVTRRDPAAVRAAMDLLGVTATVGAGDPYPVEAVALADERGLARLWRLLQLAGRFGVSPAVLSGWADPEPDAAVAQGIRDTLRARYAPEVWRAVVKPIADRLRQARRDALVAHLLQTMDLDRLEQLYEIFLVDPGTEPVVQTSRLRQAISSVQLFIQRCLLNLEPKVSPSVIDAAHFAWMKRYRVSEANLKILVWTPNWLEPEFRDDKTHLFQELESALTQTDLTNDDAEDALFGYLRGLDEIARLDIRAVYVEQAPDPSDNVVHVVGRTFAAPHKYFYRTLAHRSWTPWSPVTAEIEGDHVAIAKWRDRVHIFWVTFVPEPGKPDPGPLAGEGAATLTFGQLSGLSALLSVNVKLGWTHRFGRDWSPAGSSGVLKVPLGAMVSFDPKEEHVHATTAADGAVWVHLTGRLNTAFRVVSRHATPTLKTAAQPPRPPFAEITDGDQGRWDATGTLSSFYVDKITTKNGVQQPACPTKLAILGKISEYTLVTNGTPIGGLPSDVGNLVLPFFVADEHATFWVEPQLTERTIEQGDRLIFTTPLIEPHFELPPLVAHVPVPPGPPQWEVDPRVLYQIEPKFDEITALGKTVAFGDTVIGPQGGHFFSGGAL
jgi:hypothetical protein